ncbi:nucleotidyl transferase AbiEii/AbiGii toxin family protein [Burkholderia vietnamiensis]|uniref:nucleotidyl transferase AbiEii/AbiGii toxin family protein n=1 Tax=Burkholderia vietnamiensis TaxID=60552 RepID=UPI002652BA1D|nr:nucleotidyl transferase AbiEii/AbiGii toxin family protein [Burkholderia vietnamiensis]MDN7820884.1 nucleotidyl transferase AbiEii/AbiGii toxin family protein [Burkholderia vietnamiensis]
MTTVEDWVNSATDTREQTFRSVVHIVLAAISASHELKPVMVMKGGVLMAIRYSTGRHTTDVDFSTQVHYREFAADQDAFIDRLDTAIRQTAETLNYGIACGIQSTELQPRAEGNFQTLRIRIGYAQKGNTRAMKRLAERQSPQIVQIDYSFNEIIGDVDFLGVDGELEIQTYSESTLLAEKLRAILQQEERQRSRRQDIYDLHYFLTHWGADRERTERVLRLLIDKATSRGLAIDRQSMASTAIYERSQNEYADLAPTIEGELPPFDTAFATVRQYYESLPWDLVTGELTQGA